MKSIPIDKEYIIIRNNNVNRIFLSKLSLSIISHCHCFPINLKVMLLKVLYGPNKHLEMDIIYGFASFFSIYILNMLIYFDVGKQYTKEAFYYVSIPSPYLQ
ncbi:uncharacterized protein B0P05DRAFT_562268 [Gilbertella persicaria]|uniref:uncharacterized protein n=1 Tax=Gilbertella persicaria TaxID=101096 RepID=UPI0022201CD2|nr:uncharacterized protein B0P05DRAFT_562268 [Gilbertella persicaria]KAI8051894.1 hypothetical protein B0P05DRAFT_562268 [Gilbertella persicaria]